MSSAQSEVAYLSRALKAPRIPQAARVLAERARDESWDYEAYLAAVLSEEVSSRQTHGGQARVTRARFPQVKTLDDFDFTFQRSVKKQQVAHLAQLDFLTEAKNVVLGTAKSGADQTLYVVKRPQPPPSRPPPADGRRRVITSNRDPGEWLGVMSDPLLAQSAVDRLQSAAYELVVEGESYRRRQKPQRSRRSA